MKFRLILTIVMVVIFAILSYSQIPNTMNYQGLLTDASGVPLADGNYNLTFRIYDVASGGSALWTEAQLVLVESGIFSVILGSSTALNLDFDVPYWMGIQVAAGTELSPRIELTSAAYTFNSKNAEAIGGNTVTATMPSSGQVLKWNGSAWAPGSDNAGTSVWTTSNDDIYNSNIGNVGVGTSIPHAKMHIMDNDIGTLIVGGSVANDSAKVVFAEDSDNAYGMSILYDGFANDLKVFGKWLGTTYGPHLSIQRDDGYTNFYGGVRFNSASFTVPTGAISAPEIADEPGVGSATGTGMSLTRNLDIQLSRSITCPSAGYVLVIASCQVRVNHVSTANSNANFGVSASNTTIPVNQDVALAISNTVPNGSYDFPVTVHGLFSVIAGTNTFYFLAQEISGTFDTFDTQLSLIFIPTAYGTVTPTKFNEGPDIDDNTNRTTALTAADIASEQAEAQIFNQQRIEKELATLRAEIEAIKASSRNETDK